MSKVETQLYMTPYAASGSPRTALLAMIAGAKHTIEFGIFAFTSRQIADALIAAKHRGVKVQGVMDATQALTENNRYVYLATSGVDVRLYGERQNLMHDKVTLVDGSYPRLARLALGSYNYTGGAEDSNREVMVIMLGTAVSKEFAPVIRAQLSAAYAAGRA